MPFIADDFWTSFRTAFANLRKGISRSRAMNVNAADLREQAIQLSRLYFREVRPNLRVLAVDSKDVERFDELMKSLLRLSNAGNSKSSYNKLFKSLETNIHLMTERIELRLSEIEFLARSPQVSVLSNQEMAICETLTRIAPTAARSYQQAIVDLSDRNRISYRGPANELREALRETLDKLAPDDEVVAQPGFKLEADQTKPTMKQKTRFILKKRQLPRNAMSSPEEAIQILEERVGTFARATHERASISAHVQSERSEVNNVRNYVNAVLAELLEL